MEVCTSSLIQRFNITGRSDTSSNCNSIGYLDSIIGILTTITAYLLVIPIIYLFSQVLVANLSLKFVGNRIKDKVYSTKWLDDFL